MKLKAPPPEARASASEPLTEYVDSRGVTLRVDAVAGVLRGVKLIGLQSKNGRRYREATLRKAATLYEEAKVNVNHPEGGPHMPRDYRDRLGVIRNVQYEVAQGEKQGGLFGDLHFNPKHALAEQLAWDAQHNPRNVGFSHNVLARLGREGEETIVEEITDVRSVDLVADPATTHGLFESQSAAEKVPVEEATLGSWDALTLGTLRLHRPDLLAEIETTEATLREELTEAQSQAERLSRELRIQQLVGSAIGTRSLSEACGEAFYQCLLEAEEEQLPRLIAERAALVSRPRSADQTSVLAREDRAPTASDFAKAVKLKR